MRQAVADSLRAPTNPAGLADRLARTQVELLTLRQQHRAGEQLISELLAERASLRRDLAEWKRIAQARAERIAALEQQRSAA